MGSTDQLLRAGQEMQWLGCNFKTEAGKLITSRGVPIVVTGPSYLHVFGGWKGVIHIPHQNKVKKDLGELSQSIFLSSSR